MHIRDAKDVQKEINKKYSSWKNIKVIDNVGK